MPTPRDTILLVDDQRLNRVVLQDALKDMEVDLVLAEDGEEAIVVARQVRPALALVDVIMPGIDGFETVRRLREHAETRDLTVLFMSATEDVETKVRGFELGAVDFLNKPVQARELVARVRTHLRLRHLEHQLTDANARLKAHNDNLEQLVQARTDEILKSRSALVLGLAKLAESRDDDTGKHLERICTYTEILLDELTRIDASIDASWAAVVRETAALHDIGKVGVPDAVLKKPDVLTDDEREVIKKHTLLGGDTLLAIKNRWADDSFLVTATEIAFAHHERWDGSGYPFGLSGDTIPLAARIVAVADVYDALTSRRAYKDPMTHEAATRIIREGAGSHFDPQVVAAFDAGESRFRAVSAASGDASPDAPDPHAG